MLAGVHSVGTSRPAGTSCLGNGHASSQAAPSHSRAAPGLLGTQAQAGHWAPRPPAHLTSACCPCKLLGGLRQLLAQGPTGPVSASIDVEICQEFHCLLVKIHLPVSGWLPAGCCGGSVTSQLEGTTSTLLPGTPGEGVPGVPVVFRP